MLLHPWDFPGKSTGVGCHFLLQEVQAKSDKLKKKKKSAYGLIFSFYHFARDIGNTSIILTLYGCLSSTCLFNTSSRLCLLSQKALKIQVSLTPTMWVYHSTCSYIPKGNKAYVHTDLFTNVLAALFVIAPKWKQPKWPIRGEQINKAWYVQTMKSYSAINRDKLLIHTTIQMNLKIDESIQAMTVFSRILYRWELTHGNRKQVSGWQEVERCRRGKDCRRS